MQVLFEILPVVLFFFTFKFYDIYLATLVGMISTYILAVGCRMYTGTWDNKQLITLGVFLFFGGMTIYFHNPMFIKWKPTIIFWLFSTVILITQFFTHKPMMQRLMENMLQDKGHIPLVVWRRVNILWAVFLFCLGGVNLYIAYHWSNDAWVNFKFYGITGALLVISLLQSAYLSRYLSDKKEVS